MSDLNLKPILDGARTWFDAKSPRERLLIQAAALAGLLAICDVALLRPAIRHQMEVRDEVASLSKQLDRARSESAGLEAALRADPEAQLRRERKTLQAELHRMDEKLSHSMSAMIDPKEMTHWLESILSHYSTLELIRIETLPTRSLFEDGSGAPSAEIEASSAPMERPSIFEHPVVIELRGDYLSTLGYLREIESLPWRFFWDGLEYRVDQYPTATIELRLHSLSNREAWIGV